MRKDGEGTGVLGTGSLGAGVLGTVKLGTRVLRGDFLTLILSVMCVVFGIIIPVCWPTNPARNRLCMKPPIPYVFVLSTALLAHGEGCHGCPGAVVGQVADDGETRTAVCAVDERVVDAVRLALHVGQAIVAYGDVRTDPCDLLRSNAAGDNPEIPETGEISVFAADLFHLRSRWCQSLQVTQEIIHRHLQTFRKDMHAIVTIVHLTQYPVFQGHPVNKRTEPHTLYQSGDVDVEGKKAGVVMSFHWVAKVGKNGRWGMGTRYWGAGG